MDGKQVHTDPQEDVAALRYELEGCRAEIRRLRAAIRELVGNGQGEGEGDRRVRPVQGERAGKQESRWEVADRLWTGHATDRPVGNILYRDGEVACDAHFPGRIFGSTISYCPNCHND